MSTNTLTGTNFVEILMTIYCITIDVTVDLTPFNLPVLYRILSFFLYLPSRPNRYKIVQTEYKSGQDRKAARAALITALNTNKNTRHISKF